MTAFAKRNLKLYIRDKSTVLFSLLAVFIVIALYVLFLGDVYKGELKEFERADELMDNWVMAGVLAITSMTTTLGMLGTMVRDKYEHIEKDFFVAPVKRWQIAGGYMISAYGVGVIMTWIAFVVAEIYIVVNGGKMISLHNTLKVLGISMVSSLMNTAIALFLVSLFRSMNAFATANTIIGTLIGFLTGIYLPIGSYPAGVQWLVKLFPVSHAALVFRNVMMESVMDVSFAKVPSEFVQEIKEELGMVYLFGSWEVSASCSMGIMTITAIVFYTLACVQISRKKK